MIILTDDSIVNSDNIVSITKDDKGGSVFYLTNSIVYQSDIPFDTLKTLYTDKNDCFIKYKIDGVVHTLQRISQWR